MADFAFATIKSRGECPFKILVIEEKEGLEIVIIREQGAWSIKINETLSQMAKQHKFQCTDSKQLLDCIKNPPDDVEVKFTSDEFIINRNLDGKLRLKYFYCKLEEAEYWTCCEKVIDTLNTSNCNLAQTLSQVSRENEKVVRQKSECEQKLLDIIEQKHRDDDEIYGHFVNALNEKKIQIQHLSELLEAFKGGRPTSNPPIQSKSKRKRKIDEIPDELPKVVASESSESEPDDDNLAIIDTDTDLSSDDPVEHKSSIFLDDSKGDELGDLLDDSVLPKAKTLIPKRVKKNDAIVSQSQPSTSKQANKVSKSAHCNKNSKKPTELIAPSQKESQSIDINTQDLLDMI